MWQEQPKWVVLAGRLVVSARQLTEFPEICSRTFVALALNRYWHKLTVTLLFLSPDWLETCRTHEGKNDPGCVKTPSRLCVSAQFAETIDEAVHCVIGPHSLTQPSRISLPRKGYRVGLRIVLFVACSAFTRVTACTLALSPYIVTR